MIASGLQKNQAYQKHMGYAKFDHIFILSKFGDISPSKTQLLDDPIFATYLWKFFLFRSGTIKFPRKKNNNYFRAEIVSIDSRRLRLGYFCTIARID